MNEIEKISYLKALVYIATIDEEIDENEKKYVFNVANMYGLNQEQSDELVKVVLERKESIEEILSKITERKTKLLLIYELVALCFADDSYSEKEQIGIANIGNMLNIENDKVKKIEDLLNENVKLQQKINLALER